MLSDLAKAEAPQLGSEAFLHKRDVVHGETQDTPDGLDPSTSLIDNFASDGLLAPQLEKQAS